MQSTYRLTLSCPDRPGIVARVATTLYEHGGNILEARQFEDAETGQFFMRVVFRCEQNRDALSARDPITRHTNAA